MNNVKAEPVTDYKCLLGEGPVWDAHRRAICWIDIVNGHIHQYSTETGQHRTYAVNEMIGCFALCKNGGFIVATQSGFGFTDRESGRLTMVHDPEIHLPENRFNDGKCDPAGRFWAGTMSVSEEPHAGSVYVFDRQKVVKKIENTTIANGMAWSPDQKTLYFIDTPTFEVAAYAYDKTTGAISNRKVAIRIPKEDGFPDGMTIDTDGMLWIAHWDGWQVTRWDPATGQKLHHFKFPVSRITSCTFGGTNLSDLYITSARIGLSDDVLEKQPLAGSLFVIRDCGYTGLPAFEFDQSF
jgi:sugar lactone lactonase YvrE